MKELDPVVDAARPDIENLATPEVRKALKMLGTLTPRPGHTLYEFNLKTKVIREAVFEDELILKDGARATRKLVMQSNCVYRFFLNRKNAERKFFKLLMKLI